MLVRQTSLRALISITIAMTIPIKARDYINQVSTYIAVGVVSAIVLQGSCKNTTIPPKTVF